MNSQYPPRRALQSAATFYVGLEGGVPSETHKVLVVPGMVLGIENRDKRERHRPRRRDSLSLVTVVITLGCEKEYLQLKSELLGEAD